MKEIRHVSTGKAPRAIGPYSQAVACQGLLFCSGQIPLDPETGLLIEGDVEDQARRALENLKAVLEAGGAGLGSVLKVTVFIKDMGDFGRINAVYGEYFKEKAPARACVEVSGLPKGALVEIEAVASLEQPRS